MPPSTTIDGNLKRIFNTAVDKKGLTLRNLILTRGKADLGGAIFAGGQITLEYVVLSDNEATVAGGAIYLSGRDTGLSILESTLTKNKANKGAVLGMSCIDYLAPVSRSITIASSSMIGNGGDDNISVIHGCGQTSLTIDTSTVAQNTANAMGGILYLSLIHI